MSEREALGQITAPFFCAGFVVRGRKVVEAAPIVAYMIGWTTERVRLYCSKRRWELTRVA